MLRRPVSRILPGILLGLILAAPLASAQYTAVHVPIGPQDSVVTLHLYFFDARERTLEVIDQGDPSLETYGNLDAAMEAHKCEAGCNGGPFDAQGRPRGLVVADGKQFGELTTEGMINPGVLFVHDGRPRLANTAAFRALAGEEDSPRQLLQAGPFLVESGKPATGLSPRRIGRRTFILTDGKDRWAIGYAPATTLPQLAQALADPKTFKSFAVATALNLDGGSSSGIWVRRKYGPLYLKELRPVRNFLGIVRR